MPPQMTENCRITDTFKNATCIDEPLNAKRKPGEGTKEGRKKPLLPNVFPRVPHFLFTKVTFFYIVLYISKDVLGHSKEVGYFQK